MAFSRFRFDRCGWVKDLSAIAGSAISDLLINLVLKG